MQRSQRQEQKLQTRERIVEAAMKQFAEYGLISSRTSDIANAARVSHGTIFVHFPSKEILLDTVIEEFGKRITNRLHELVSCNSGMKEVLEAHLQGISEYEAFYARLITESRLLNESARSSLVLIQSAISFHIIQVAEREMEEYRIRTMPFDLLFNTWIGLVHHYLINGDLFAPEGQVMERYSNILVDYFIKLISK